MGAVRTSPGSPWATSDVFSRTVTLRAAVASAIASAAGLAVLYRLLSPLAWALLAAAAAALISLVAGYPLRVRRSPRLAVACAIAAIHLSASATAATGGLHSVNLVIDLTVFSLAATLCPPPLPILLAVSNCLVIALPGVAHGPWWSDWRPALATLGACTAVGYYSLIAHLAVTVGVRDQRRLRAAAAIGRAMTMLDLDRLLPEVAAETGRLLDAGSVVITAWGADGAESSAAWTAPGTRRPGAGAEVAAACARASGEQTALVRHGAGPWEALGDGRFPPDATGLVVPFGSGGRPAGAIGVLASPPFPLPAWSWDALRELADYTALGVRAAELHAESRRQALIDPITHLYNARYLGLRLEEEISRARRRGEPLSLLFLDSDSLKITNDRYGHQHGDRLVRSLAQLITQNVRAEDVPVRYAGGDEFVVILPNTDWPEAAEIAERLCRAARRLPVGPHGEAIGTVSIGVATFPVHAMTADELVARADQAMYAAKSAGKDCVAVYGRGAQAQAEPFLAP